MASLHGLIKLSDLYFQKAFVRRAKATLNSNKWVGTRLSHLWFWNVDFKFCPCREANTNFLLLFCILYVLIRSHWINLIKIFYNLHILSYKIKKIWTNSIQPFVSNKLSKLRMLIRSSPIIFKVWRDRKYLITPACSAWKVL